MHEELKKTVADLLKALEADVEAVDIVGTEKPCAKIRTSDSQRLIGPGGEHLRALNHIAKKLLEKKLGLEPRIANLLDVNGYFEAKLETIRANARMLAQRARLFKHDVEMSPMSSYERMVVHELFAEDQEIKTESQGEGKVRHVVLRYVEQGTAPQI